MCSTFSVRLVPKSDGLRSRGYSDPRNTVSKIQINETLFKTDISSYVHRPVHNEWPGQKTMVTNPQKHTSSMATYTSRASVRL